MKNLLVYLSPDKKFNEENDKYVRIQIENSLDYWDKDDILLVTNFPYEYMGVKALVVPDNLYSEISKCVVKINVIVYLLENNIIDDLTWFHDTEAWQVAPLNIELNKDVCLTDYGWSSKWNGGSMFFYPSALDIFKLWKKSIEDNNTDDERAFMLLTENNFDDINERIQRLNITYNIGKRRVKENVDRADKPLRVLHFHPYRENLLEKFYEYLPENLKKIMYAEDTRYGG